MSKLPDYQPIWSCIAKFLSAARLPLSTPGINSKPIATNIGAYPLYNQKLYAR